MIIYFIILMAFHQIFTTADNYSEQILVIGHNKFTRQVQNRVVRECLDKPVQYI